MGGCRCSFRECPVGTSQNPGMHFFHFPLNHKERYRRWLKLANKMHFLDSNNAYQKNRVICARHFRDECFKNYKRNGLNKTAEPTLMRLNDDMALDYSHEEENGGPELIKLVQCTLKHLIPPEGYVFAFSFHDNLVVNEYLKENNIVLGNTDEARQLLIKKRNRENNSVNFEDCSSAKKIKILNSTAINLPSKTSDSTLVDTIINIKIDQGASALDLPLDTEVNFESEAAGEDISIESEEEGEYDFIQIGNYINDNSVELESDNTSIFNQQKCDELSKELQDKNEKYIKKTEELLARIRELEKDLGQSKDVLKKKTTILSRTEIELDKATTAYQTLLENYKELENKYKNELEINKNTSMENQRLQQEKSSLSKKCMEYEKQKKLKQKESVTTSQAPSSSIDKEITIGNRRNPGGHNNMQNTPSKAQLFNGIKKYISSSMLALLRMEMFGGADRNWKPDEQRVAMDLLQLGDEVYKYINDEWRFRLPALGEVRAWLADTTNSIDDEEDL